MFNRTNDQHQKRLNLNTRAKLLKTDFVDCSLPSLKNWIGYQIKIETTFENLGTKWHIYSTFLYFLFSSFGRELIESLLD